MQPFCFFVPKDVAGARKAYKGAGQQVALMNSGNHTEQFCPLVEKFLYPNWGSKLPCILTQTAANSQLLPGVDIQMFKTSIYYYLVY